MVANKSLLQPIFLSFVSFSLPLSDVLSTKRLIHYISNFIHAIRTQVAGTVRSMNLLKDKSGEKHTGKALLTLEEM